MTRVRDGKNVIISEFQTRADLIQVLLCSAYIPLWSGFIPPIYKGERYVDGALSNNLPRINKYTITVSPFAGHSDICPKNESPNIHYWLISNTSFQFTIKNLYRLSRIMFPPHPEKLSQICKQGFEDALSYLKENHMVNCSRHLAIRSVLSRSVSTSFSDDGEEAEDEHDGCEHCTANRMKDRELHPSVITALEDAVNVVNSNYMLYMKNLRSYRTFSVLCSPLYLPFDVTVATFSNLQIIDVEMVTVNTS
ncbi:bmm [Bugula neritina]|uniref:Bmm n=1 Tax=Bugula neritina TaxID=10212 RepID=A0A7J7JPC3_BUGNE|nr:bmm [Bugula neritina]